MCEKVLQIISPYPSIIAPVILCKLSGNSLQRGIFLNQLLYWRSHMKGAWLLKSYSDWTNEIFLSKYEVRKATDYFKELGILETKVKRANGSPTVHYQIIEEACEDWLIKSLTELNKTYDKELENKKELSK